MALSHLAKQKSDPSKYGEALKQYEYALMIDTDNAGIYCGQGRIYTILACQEENSEKAKKLQKAIESYEKNIDILKNSDSNISPRLAANYAYVLQKSGKPQDAYDWYHKAEQSLERNPNQPYQYYDKACYYALHYEFSRNDENIEKA